MSAGRPSLYDPAYCDQIVAHMADGASVASFAAEIDVARSTINAWASEHEEFSEALSRAKTKCAAWWEKTGRIVASSGTGNASMVIFGLRNMAGDDWQDVQKRELSGPNGAPITTQAVTPREMTDEELEAEIARLKA